MATQGLVSLVNKQGRTLVKCVAGCDGYEAKQVAKWLKKHPTIDIGLIYKKCLELDFGCDGCLIVMNSSEHFFEGERFHNDDLAELYVKTFDNPRFNPRWDIGTCEYIEIVPFQ